MSTSKAADPWGWLGLLKWSLSYSDGTRSSDVSPMSKEDREFLEKVMAEGIIDENERMKFILQEATKAMDYYKGISLGGNGGGDPPLSQDDLEDLLQELRDIVEQIDYARAFCSLQGLPFLVGCIEEVEGVPEGIRMMCAGILSTLCQNNPPVQKQLLELGSIKNLSDVFFLKATSVSMKARIMQAISSIVRNHEIAETVFCSLPQAKLLIADGLDPNSSSQQLQTRTLFFLRALITSDTAEPQRISVFENDIICIMDNYLLETVSRDIREMAVSFLQQLLEEKKGVETIMKRKDFLAAQGVARISNLRGLSGEEKDSAATELEHWESFLVLLARAG